MSLQRNEKKKIQIFAIWNFPLKLYIMVDDKKLQSNIWLLVTNHFFYTFRMAKEFYWYAMLGWVLVIGCPKPNDH